MSFEHRIKAFHTASAAHHTTLARCHSDAVEKADMERSSGFDHEKAAESHATMAQYHCDCAKAMDGSDLEKGMMRPTEILAINPEPAKTFAVPRTGQRPLPLSGETAVDPQFRKIVEVD